MGYSAKIFWVHVLFPNPSSPDLLQDLKKTQSIRAIPESAFDQDTIPLVFLG